MREPVERACLLRQEAAGVLVLALRPALDPRDAALDGEFDRLVVAGLEVQARHIVDGAPVAPVQRRGRKKIQRRRHGPAFVLRQDEKHIAGHARGQHPEERAIQVGRRAVGAIGAPVAVGEEIQVRFGRLEPGHAAQDHAGIGHLASFLADLLALVVG